MTHPTESSEPIVAIVFVGTKKTVYTSKVYGVAGAGAEAFATGTEAPVLDMPGLGFGGMISAFAKRR